MAAEPAFGPELSSVQLPMSSCFSSIPHCRLRSRSCCCSDYWSCSSHRSSISSSTSSGGSSSSSRDGGSVHGAGRRLWSQSATIASAFTLLPPSFAAGLVAVLAGRRARRRSSSYVGQQERQRASGIVACYAAKGKGKGKGGGGGKAKGKSSGSFSARGGKSQGGKGSRTDYSRLRGEKRKEEEEEEEEEKEDMDIFLIPKDGMPLSDLADKLGKNPAQIIKHCFMEKKLRLTLTSVIMKDLCIELADLYEVEWLDEEEFEVSAAADRGFLAENIRNGRPRPPVVTVMGHVDHGKTTLLDTIRKRSVAATEAGGITQRIGAYTVDVHGSKITFIDTPGHEAFTAMRARGAQVTDIAVLVCAADDGVMPQTREALAHAQAADVPIIVCINKVDVPKADIEQARNGLMELGLIPEEYGGDVPMLPCSAKLNRGIDELLEMIALTAETSELKAIYDGPAGGVVLESQAVPHLGIQATLLVQKGQLKVGDYVAAGDQFGRIRGMKNDGGQDMDIVPPSMAVQVTGFGGAPTAGSQFQVYRKQAMARAEAAAAAEKQKQALSRADAGLMSKINDTAKLSLILKTDTQGSIAAVKHMFSEVKDSKWVSLRWLLAAPGAISQTDVELATSCPEDQLVMIVGFNAEPLPGVQKLADSRNVQIRTFDVIYKLQEAIVKALEGDLGQMESVRLVGQAEVLAVFDGAGGKVAGCAVLDGQLIMGGRVEVMRDGKEVGSGIITTLRSGKTAVDDISEGSECGLFVDGFDAWQPGDELICYEVSMVDKKVVEEKQKTT